MQGTVLSDLTTTVSQRPTLFRHCRTIHNVHTGAAELQGTVLSDQTTRVSLNDLPSFSTVSQYRTSTPTRQNAGVKGARSAHLHPCGVAYANHSLNVAVRMIDGAFPSRILQRITETGNRQTQPKSSPGGGCHRRRARHTERCAQVGPKPGHPNCDH